ncbi:hypothetical protein TWF730_011143 [Orbilia blumenaviensis]|uniref:Glucanase n=1 Tax=Orbilia blumenaviensis TaxID=1796055 RepID=A0AAV9UJL0_9PEZI
MAFKYAYKLSLTTFLLSRLSVAQVPGTNPPEVHPKLPTYKCTRVAGCVKQDTSVVLDWVFRSIHTVSTNEPCKTAWGVDRTICPDQLTCSKRCVVEGMDYYAAGVSTSGDALTLYQYNRGGTDAGSPRVYLLGPDGNYVLFNLNGQEISFDVDLSELPCGENGALYLSEMQADGGRSTLNPGGANYGSGYCDAQCPYQTWKNGNLDAAGPYCCNEMDILEANSRASQFAPHACAGNDCDKTGCPFNPYARGYKNYWGPGMTVDTTQPIRVLTQFITDDGSPHGTLSIIRRKYIQNGQVIASASASGDEIRSDGCLTGEEVGGFATMTKSFERGMVLAFSIWNDPGQYMHWLDSGDNGPCSATEGAPSYIQANYPNARVIFSKIRWGELDSTTSNTNPITTTSTTASGRLTTKLSSTLSTTSRATTTANTDFQSQWSQCYGIGYTGPTRCASGYTCSTLNPYYGQCL